MKMGRNAKVALSSAEATNALAYHLPYNLLERIRQFFSPRNREALDNGAAMEFLKKHGSKNNRAIARVGAKMASCRFNEKMD